jgi:two-component system, NarL family, response regulator LiaR
MAISRTSISEKRCFDPIRVMVVEEHARVRQGLRMFLSTCADIEVVAEAGNGAEALRHFTDTRPDVVLMHLGTPGMDSPIVTCRMKELCPGSQIIALANEADPDMERRALAAGAQRCVLKDSSAGALVAAIYEARAGLHWPAPAPRADGAEQHINRAVTLSRGAGATP